MENYIRKDNTPKIAYCYDDETKKFEYTMECQLDPLESLAQDKDIFLLPANSTFKEPHHQDGKITIWDGENWQYVENIVGRKYYDFQEKTIKEIKKINEKQILFTKEQEELLNKNPDMTIELKDNVYKIYYTDEQLIEKARGKRNRYIKEYVDYYQEKPLLWNELPQEKKDKIEKYRKYLLEYPNKTENWYKKEPLIFDEFK